MFPEVITSAVQNTALYTALSFVLHGVGAGVGPDAAFEPQAVPSLRHRLHQALPRASGADYLALRRVRSSDCVQWIPYSGWRARQGLGRVGARGRCLHGRNDPAGIEAVPKGQTEAARSLGMSQTRTMFTIILPQGSASSFRPSPTNSSC